MANIGTFGTAKKEAEKAVNPNREPDTFTYFGEEIRIADEIGMAPLMEFAVSAAEGSDSNDMDGLAAIHAMLKDSVDEADFPKFWSLTKKNKAQPELLLEIVRTVMEVVSGRPTDRPSDSSFGPSLSSPPSNSSLQALASSEPEVLTAHVG